VGRAGLIGWPGLFHLPNRNPTMNALVQTLLRAQTYSFRGRLAADPEIKYLANSMVANAKMAVDHPEKKGRDDGKEPDWLKLEIWFEAAEEFANNARKGQLSDCTGRIRFESWTDKQTGEPRHQPVLKLHSWAPVDTTAPVTAAKPAAVPAAGGSVWESSAGDINEDEVPF
jgi:single-strand DNA-binding protein